ncbi:MAG: cytochrome P450 [Actinobacteria bacterium]|nr:MAG: cytochrome P450 [Actinomycetota bacterium]
MNIDLNDLDVWQQGVPHEQFKWLRENDPVYFQSQPDGPGYWCLTKHEDIVKASKNFHGFSSAKGMHITDPINGAELMLINMDPPGHTRLRNLVSKGFHPRMITALEDKIREVVTEILDTVGPKGECDFVTDIAAELPLIVICELAGVPPEDRHKIFSWSNTLIGTGNDPEYSPGMEAAQNTFVEMNNYANLLAEFRRHEPREDLVSAIANAEIDGDRLGDLEISVFFVVLMIAGNETTRNLIAGGMRALCEHTDQAERLKGDPELFKPMVEEMLRYVSPVNYFRRTATEDFEMRGKQVKAGEKVVMWYTSGNRDEEVFENSMTFDVGRRVNPHVAFGGGGPHFCLGFSLAQLEIKVMFEELFRRLPDVKISGPVQRLRSNFINGTRHMPVGFTPEPVRV